MQVTMIDCTPSRCSGHSSFSVASLNDSMRPRTDGSFTYMPSALLCRYGAVAHIEISDGVR